MSTLTAPVRRVLAIREDAIAIGDANLVAEIDAQLARWGITATETRSVETATPVPSVKRTRTRTRKGD
jgi:hypothetical protein